VGILLIYNTFSFEEMIAIQQGPLTFSFLGEAMTIPFLPNWGIFYQPLGFILFFLCAFAETNRLPFDLPEAEAELVAGFHTEYGGIKMNMFYIGEYGHMMVASALLAVFYFGGYNLPIPGVTAETISTWLLQSGFSATKASLLSSMLLFAVFFVKMMLFLWVFVWVRWTLPRFRYDQLMDLGWKTLLPWALANTVVTAVVILLMNMQWGA
jgi:NADH-quinone oxidoreductase subunit H